ncbi:MAG TPA: hypothetical protein VJO34_17565, partial [Methylomirabilota bacterium]|nr:hypothetical protein [Methylomirabilota bacterium]
HVAPFYFYLGAFPVEFLPWTLFLPQAMILGRGQRGGEDSRGWWFAFCWLVTPLAFFSLSSGKRDIYMLPAFPAAALLVGWAWSRWWLGVSGRRSFRGVIIPALLLVVSLWGLAGGVLAGSEWMLATRNRLLFPETLEARLWTAVLLGLGGALLASAAIMRRPRWVFGCTVGFFWLAMTAGVALIYNPQFNQRYPIKAFAQAIRSSIDPGKPLRACGNVNDLGLSFNLNRFLPAQTESDVTRYLTSDDPAWCVMNRRAYRRISEQTGRHFTVVVEQEFDRSTLLLVSNRP